MEDLWAPETFDSKATIEESKAVAILQEQAKLLKRNTNGRVCAVLSKLKEKTLSSSAMRELLGNVTRALEQAEDEDELKGKKDIGTQYDATAYKFEIFNSVYHFRVFELIDKKLFPVKIICDLDIADQLRMDEVIIVEDNKSFVTIIKRILGSKKVKSVISSLMN